MILRVVFGAGIVRRLIWDPLRLGLFIFFYLIRPIKPVKIIIMHEARIGSLAQHADLFLRRRREVGNSAEPKGWWMGVSQAPSNEQLLKMLQRHMPILRSRYVKRLFYTPMFRRSPFVGSFPYPKSAADFELYNANPVLTFTEAEEDLGEGLLKDMGIPEGAWFVCFHVRDPSYEIQNFSESYWKESPSVYQNCSVANFIDAMRYIADCGGYAIRMGAAISDRLPDLGEARIIDYASDHRTDFGDIFLSAKCKFFVGTYSGLSMIANIFNVPSVKTNMFHHTNEPYTKRDLIIFKHHWSTEKSRMLTLSEMFELDMGMNSTQEYQQAGISVLENSPEEILAVTKEMNERLEGIFPTVKGDMELQQRFHALLEPRHQLYLSPAMAGAEYLRTQQSSLR